MLRLKNELAMSLLLITHDLGVVAQMASRVVVMYAGQVVEEGGVIDIFDQAFHPYTRGLLKSIPKRGGRLEKRVGRLVEIPGTVPPLTETITGCKFTDRCPHAFGRCLEQQPGLFRIQDGHNARCWLWEHPERRRDNV
jgi:oligopeptide/dipeptide ABC transporter ATP-binding protein